MAEHNNGQPAASPQQRGNLGEQRMLSGEEFVARERHMHEAMSFSGTKTVCPFLP